MNECLNSSNLWKYVRKLTLKTNIRVRLQNGSSAEYVYYQVLYVGNGKMEVDEFKIISLYLNF